MLHACLRLLLALPALLLPAVVSAQVQLLPGTSLYIDGTSSARAFTCTAEDAHRRLAVHREGAANRLSLPVAAFDCGHDRINRDFRNALGAEAHPEIRFTLAGADLVGDPASTAYTLRAEGRLALAAVERPVSFLLTVRERPDGTYEAVGEHALRMTDFGIDPPTALFGLIRTRDAIVVRYRFHAALSTILPGR